ncbi:MAG: hypothetical protein Q9227_003888 [Pyrenula ochraceoflavens]
MAELLSLITTSLTILSNVIHLPTRLLHHRTHSLIETIPFSSPADAHYAKRRFPSPPMAFLAALFLDLRAMRKLESETLNSSSPDSVMAFKDSHISAVGATSVASAILAQLSMTTLQLGGFSDIHWSAAGVVLSSLLFGVLSVIVSTGQQQVFGMLNDAERVRMWLSCGYYEDEEDEDTDVEVNPIAISPGMVDGPQEATLKATYAQRCPGRRLKASAASIQIMRLPNTLLSFEAVAFLVGIGLFLGFAARQDLDRTPARDNNRAVLGLWCTVGILLVLECGGSSLWKMREGRAMEKQWGETVESSNGDEEAGRQQESRDRGPFPRSNEADRESDDGEEEADERTSLVKQRGKHTRTTSQHTKVPTPTLTSKSLSSRDQRNKDALAQAFEESAKAHLQAAEADREVARLLRKP